MSPRALWFPFFSGSFSKVSGYHLLASSLIVVTSTCLWSNQAPSSGMYLLMNRLSWLTVCPDKQSSYIMTRWSFSGSICLIKVCPEYAPRMHEAEVESETNRDWHSLSSWRSRPLHDVLSHSPARGHSPLMVCLVTMSSTILSASAQLTLLSLHAWVIQAICPYSISTRLAFTNLI